MHVRFGAGDMCCDLVCRESRQPFLKGHSRVCGDVWMVNAVSPHFRNTFMTITAVILFVHKGPFSCR